MPTAHVSPLVTVVTVNWNSGAYLRSCVRAVSVSSEDAALIDRFVIVDNGSNDGSADGLDVSHFPIVLIRNRENLGFAAACNQGAALAATPYILFLNPDTRVHKSAIASSVAFLNTPGNQEFGVCGGQLINELGLVERSCARYPALANLINQSLGLSRLFPLWFPGTTLEEWDHGSSREVPHVMGAYFLVRSAVFWSLGGFDERFFVYLEDLDFSLRLRRAGYRSFYLASAQIEHIGGGTSRQDPARRLFYSLASRLSYADKHFSQRETVMISLCTLLIEPAVRLVRAFLRFDWIEIRSTAAAYAMLFRHILWGRHDATAGGRAS